MAGKTLTPRPSIGHLRGQIVGEHSGKMATETVRLRIAGMGRDGCVAAVQEALGKVEGVGRVAVDLTTGTAEVDLEPPADPTCSSRPWTAPGTTRASPELRVPVGVTVYGNSLVPQLELMRTAEEASADWLILQPPAVGAFAGAEMIRTFGRLADAASLPVAIQNAPALMQRGLDVEAIAALVAAHPNITHLKGEIPVVQLAQVIEICGDKLVVLNGQGGLEMIDSLRAGCGGFVLAPDIVDHAVRIWRRWQRGDTTGAEADYASLLPEIVFVMRSIEHLIAYGKRVFCLRAGLPVHDRAPCDRPTSFGLACADRYAAALGRFGLQPC
jgi:2-keto-3-deoxy-L-arabinonate dehydratase